MVQQRVDVIGAEARAVEYGARARHVGDGSFKVRSESRAGHSWSCRAEAVAVGKLTAVRVRCDCESGSARSADLIPCWHAALVARRLERMRWVRWRNGAWWMTDVGIAAIRRVDATIDLWDPKPKKGGRDAVGDLD